MKKSLLLLIGMILGAGVYLAWQGYASKCPCGFDFDPLTGGCKVHLGPVNCGGGGPGGEPGTGPSGSSGIGSGAAETPGAGNRPNSCLYSTTLCSFDRARQIVSVQVDYNGSVIPNSGSAPPINVALKSERPNDCVAVTATFTGGNPRGFAINIPLSAGVLAAFIAGTPGARMNSSTSCSGTPAVVKIHAIPQNSACGCAVTFPN